jgi:pantoate--beta-alanine ligase
MIPVEIVGAPTLRAPDGLALSSRNMYLSVEERGKAPAIHAALQDAAAAIRAGMAPEQAAGTAAQALAAAGFEVDYVTARHAETLAEASSLEGGPIRLLAAARLGKTRLIDNIAV